MLQEIALARIAPNPDQARRTFTDIPELAASIAKSGLVQPIKLRPRPDDRDSFEIVAGERRYRAHVHLWETGRLPSGKIKAIVETMDEHRRDVEMTIENGQRVNITAIEEARNYKRFLDKGISEQDLAAELGLSQPWRISERVRLLNLAPEHLKLVEGGGLTGYDALEIARLERHADQARIIRMISQGKLTSGKAVRSAVLAVLNGLAQSDIFGNAEQASQSELDTVSGMEKKVARLTELVAGGFKDGECVIARKVSPDRAALMAERLLLIRKHVRQMENQLREAAAQGHLILGE